jgi:hypothetical protein
MIGRSCVIDADVPNVTPVEEEVLNALRSYIKAIDTAQMALVQSGDIEAATQAELDQFGSVIAVVEHTQLTLYSALRAVGRPVPSLIHSG